MLRLVTLSVLTISSLALLSGCDRSESTPAPAPAAEATEAVPGSGPRYSPFVVEVTGTDLPFEHITFKDVGISVAPDDQEFIYETIAQSLSAALGADQGMSLEARVLYSEDAADPAHHRACAARHVYVDVWHSAESLKWGYSLWSGCGEDDQFAWREFAATSPDPASVDPLTRDIAAHLGRALATGCFTRNC
ncbi:MAG: hypothetical protein DRJ42_16805 [Deltaproteobacteria bacterium]|nr:MAG: hypothetical protein DRJ42_16805 [Deltaproteobacteria bacterium]